jgi:hypothetical protein
MNLKTQTNILCVGEIAEMRKKSAAFSVIEKLSNWSFEFLKGSW